MRISRLYHPEQLTCGEETTLTAEASSHLIKVLRTRPGSPLVLFNGDGCDYHAITIDNNARKTRVSIETKIEKFNESNLDITLIQGLSRHDRMDATIQKSIELGVNRIIPVLCQRSNAKLDASKREKKLSHWQKIAISACEQSGRSIIPEISEIIPINKLCSHQDDWLHLDAERLLLDPESQTGLKNIEIKDNSIEILIGPEGGLSAEEISQLADTGFTSICFGPRILRTETAGPAVISAFQTLWGDF